MHSKVKTWVGHHMWGLTLTSSVCCAALRGSVSLTFCGPWTAARQAPLGTGFSRQAYCGGLPCPPPGDLPNPGSKPRSPALQADFLLVGSPRILDWAAYHFSSGYSWPRNETWVSCVAGWFFTNWAIREALLGYETYQFNAQIPEVLLLPVFGYCSLYLESDTW